MPKFDVVVGNPPYQKGKDKLLYMKFIKLSYEISSKYIIFINPTALYTTRVKFFDDYKCKFEYINLDPSIGEKYFKGIGLGSLFTYYLINKDKNNCETEIDYGSSKKIINLKKIKYNLLDKRNFNHVLASIFEKIYKNGVIKPIGGKGDLIRDKENSWHIFKHDKDNVYKYPAYLSSKENRRNVFSKEKSEGYDIPKLTVAGILEPKRASRFSEYSENKGVGRYSSYFPVKNEKEANNLKEFFNSDFYSFLNKEKRTGRYAFLDLPKLDFSKSWTNEELYEYFNLTQEEIDYIESKI